MTHLLRTSRRSREAGQTLVETLVAAFVLVMGITAAAGLAIYALGTSGNVIKQIVGVGLAREGIEAVKAMRDTNWLKAPLSNDCFSFDGGTAPCYRTWLNATASGGYDIDPGSSAASYRLAVRPQVGQPYFELLPAAQNWGLDSDTATTSPLFSGLYTIHQADMAAGLPEGNSGYYRKIILSVDTAAPFNHDLGPRLKVVSQVWWQDKKCPASADWPGLGRCSVELQTYLTNWKDYRP